MTTATGSSIVGTSSTENSPGGLSGNTLSGQPVGDFNTATLDSFYNPQGMLASIYGTKAQTANPGATQSMAIDDNLGSFNGSADLTLSTDAVSAEGAALPFEMNLPNYNSMMNTDSSNAETMLQGQLPQDVQDMIATQAAERGVTTGQGVNSPDSSAAYLQALGLNSLSMENQGQTDMSQLIGETPTGASYDQSKMYINPSDVQAAQQNANNIAAAPDPGTSGLVGSIMSLL